MSNKILFNTQYIHSDATNEINIIFSLTIFEYPLNDSKIDDSTYYPK